MNLLKTLFGKVFESPPPVDPSAPVKEEAPFEWNPDEETVAPTSAKATSWKRGDTPDDGPKHSPGEDSDAAIAASAHNLPAPMFEAKAQKGGVSQVTPPPRPNLSEPGSAPSLRSEEAPHVLLNKTPPVPRLETTAQDAVAVSPMARTIAPAAVPLSDFEDVYRKAGIKSPVHGYGVERVYRLVTSRRLVGLDRSVRRSALLTALDAAGIPPSDVSQDAVLRRKALTAFEAEKALELQSLRSRNESRAEALQDTVETFTRQKQSQIERLAQGSTSAVRAQSDLEIRKRMEQDRLYRSLAYFVEPLPSPAAERSTAPIETPVVIERFDATIEMSLPLPPLAEVESPLVRAIEEAHEAEVVTVATDEEIGSDTRPISQSGLEMALRAAAEESKTAGWGKTAIVEDGAKDAVDALRKLRDAQKPPETQS